MAKVLAKRDRTILLRIGAEHRQAQRWPSKAQASGLVRHELERQ